MKRPRSQLSRHLESDHGRYDDAYETDLTELDDILSSPKRHRSIESASAPELGGPVGTGVIYNNPLDDTGIDLSEIPEDFDKAEGTIVHRERIEGRWKRYCISRTRLEPKASNNDMYRFLGWCLKLEREKKSRYLKGIHKSSSLEADWKNLRGYYQRLTKTRINDHNRSEVHRGLKYLVYKNRLNTQPTKKTPVYIEDIDLFNETILSTQEKKFHLRFQRIQIYIFNSLGLFTFKDLQISLQKDPHGDPPVRLIELIVSGTKKFLGQTKLTTFTLPEVIYRPLLILCLYTLIFGILFYTQAFQNPNLILNTKLRNLFISKGCEQLLYIFSKTEVVKEIPTIQWTKPMSKSAIASMLVTFGEIRGWKEAFHAHQFRYGSGKVVSKKQHILIIKYSSPRTFLNHYHPLQLNTNMIQVICGLDPDVELIQAVTRQSCWRDTRRPRYLTKQQRGQVEDHSNIEEARRKLDNACALYEESQQLSLLSWVHQREKELKNTRQQLLRALQQQVQENFNEEQAFLDIKAQLSGTAVKEESEDKESSLQDNMDPLQLLLLQRLLSYPTSNSIAAKSIPLTGSEPDLNGSPNTRDSLVENMGATFSPRDKLFRATQNHLIDTLQKPQACFQYFVNKKLLNKTHCKMFHDAGCVTRYFDTHHLHEDPLKYNYCEVLLVHKMAFQRHASDIHRVESRWRESRDVR
ncbi:hypothetical protein BDV26DRAFT_303912 [Aspergillus bertholletiae]|uniref:C2H2 finger domain protein n=1 Tax=Aspergillus bertholletiae TaxID=1226010 RepID=A0A5N7BB99_9EURO|nr:hypothetical protein BDV26DRAFT_303912 [Aspergillus bertholletiae]